DPRRERTAMRSVIPQVVILALLVSSPVAAQAPPASPERPTGQPEEPVQLPPCQVIGTTPLPSLGIPLEKYPGNAQRVTAEEIKKQSLPNLPEQLFRNLASAQRRAHHTDP